MKLRMLTAAILGLVLPLSACTGSDVQSQPSASASASSTTDATAPTIDRDPKGELPTITFGNDGTPTMAAVDADPPTVISVKTLTPGDGATVEEGAYITVNYAGFLWSDGTEFDSSFSRGESSSFSLNQVVDGWKYGLVGTKIGDRVLVVIPPEYGYGDQESDTIPANSTLVFVVDILGVASVTTDALVEATPTGAELPTGMSVTGELGQEPKLTFAADAPEPTEDQVIVLATGKGAAITDTDTLAYQVAGAKWGESSTSTWDEGFQQAANGGGIEIVGQTIGSRVVLIYAADDEAQTDAQVFVLDLLGTLPS